MCERYVEMHKELRFRGTRDLYLEDLDYDLLIRVRLRKPWHCIKSKRIGGKC